MLNLQIEGGAKLKGEINAQPNKNSILKIIPASILCSEKVTLDNVPQSSSVKALLDIYTSIGGKVEILEDNKLILDPRNITITKIPDELAVKERSSLLFLGPLLAKFGKASVRDSGGCKLGHRPLDTMFQGLRMLGAEIDKTNGYSVKSNNKRLKGTNIWLLEASVTGTENLIMASVLAEGTITIYNAACEPHTQDLCNFLNAMGANIEGIGTNKLVINGVDQLKGGYWKIISDHIDIGCLIISALVTKGELTIHNAIPSHMTQIINNIKKFNAKVEIRDQSIYVPPDQDLICLKNFKGDIDKVNDQPWPGFPADLIPQILILAMCSEGQMRIYSNMYEIQFIELVGQLSKMRANITLTNPNQIITLSKSKLKSDTVYAPTILQATHSLILAGMVASGTTTIIGADNIFRRFPNIVSDLNKLGVNISIKNDL